MVFPGAFRDNGEGRYKVQLLLSLLLFLLRWVVCLHIFMWLGAGTALFLRS